MQALDLTARIAARAAARARGSVRPAPEPVPVRLGAPAFEYVAGRFQCVACGVPRCRHRLPTLHHDDGEV